MKNIASKKITQKIFLIVLIVLLVSCIIPNYSTAQLPSDRGTDTDSYKPAVIDTEITAEDVSFDAGTLMTPIKKFVKVLGDSAMALVQKIVVGNKMKYPIKYVKPTGDQETGEGHDAWDDVGDNRIGYPAFLYLTPESIFRNQIATLNPNFINPVNLDGTLEKALGNEEVTGDGSIKTHSQNVEENLNKLRSTIAKWYVAIRNFSLVGLLSVLVYIGIRVVISSTASDKAKYKQMISSWIGAICLIFLLHYIMAFTFTLTDKLTELFNTNMGNPGISLPSVVGDAGRFKFKDNDDLNDFDSVLSKLQEEKLVNKGNIISGDEIIGVANLMQYARLYANLNGASGLGYCIVYLFLVGFTVLYTAKYMARFIRLAFLTLIAPLITLTYPIDKLNDGQAQAFNMWLKEFVFNVLIQPFHLLIYMIFISSAIDFANSNIIYTIVVLGFMTQAEKLLRKMFGFEKASTMGAFSGAAAGSMLANVASKIGNKVVKGNGGSGGNGESSGSGDGARQPDKIRAKEDPYEGLNLGDSNKQGQQAETQEINPIGLDEQDKSTQQKMPDDYNENYGTKDYDSAERENLGMQNQSTQEPDLNLQMQQQQELQQNENNDSKEKFKDSFRRGGKAVEAVARNKAMSLGNKTGIHGITALKATRGMGAKARAKALGKEAWSGVKTTTPKALKLGAKTAGRYTFAGTAALIAGSAALMSGDPSKIASAVGIASAAGSKTGGAIADKGIARISKDWDIGKRGYYGKDYADKQKAILNDKWKNDVEIDNKYREAFGNEKFQDAKEAALEMRENYGTTDDDEIIKSLKMTDEFGGEKAKKEAQKANAEVPTLELAKRIPAFSKEISDDMYDDYDKYNTGRNKMIDKFTRQPGYDLKKAEQTTDTILKQVARVKGKEIPVEKVETNKKPTSKKK